MPKRWVSAAIVYALLAMAGGVFFREYTKAVGFAGDTALSLVHVHYLTLGTLFFLLLALLDKAFGLAGRKGLAGWIRLYHAGLNLTVAGLFVRGLTQAQGAVLSRGADGALSGVSGLGHIALGVSLIALLWMVRKSASGTGTAAVLEKPRKTSAEPDGIR